MNIDVRIIEGPLPAAEPWRAADAGAVVRFDGVVRPTEEDRELDALVYEVYEPMTTRLLHQLAEDLAAQHGLVALRCEHSVGPVPAAACSFRLHVAAAHRKQALAAMDAFIDRMKRDVPIWKVPQWRSAPLTLSPRHPVTPSTRLADPHEALAALLAKLRPVSAQRTALQGATGRVLADPVKADRPSPACDVSAMDGYALRLPAALGEVPVADEVAIGQPPPPLPPGSAVRIFTGGAVPAHADIVIPREHVAESPTAITIPPDYVIKPGANIRRMGENLAAGETVLDAGNIITPAAVAALATFGIVEPAVFRRVRISILTTGDEVLPPDTSSAATDPWQLRDSNGPFLHSLLGALPWIEPVRIQRVRDDLAVLRQSLEQALADSDAVVLTGGVSMGDHDHVPEAVRQAGGDIVFHKLAIRPGKPMLGALGPAGQAILGLPGNPVSVMATARRFALPALRKLAGWSKPDVPPPAVELMSADDKTLHLWWYRPVRLIAPGRAERVRTMGSGDVASAGRSDGVIEVPPGASGPGPWPFYAWHGD